MIGSFGARPTVDAGRSATIKGWVRDAFGLGEDVTVMVSELTCTEPGCPPLETVIAILDAPGHTRRFKVHKPLGGVAVDDVRSLVADPHAHPTTDQPLEDRR